MAATASRREFLQFAGMAGATALLAACGGATGTSPAVSAPGSIGGAAAKQGETLPAYVPVQGAKPDLPGTPEGIDDGYLTFPKTLAKSVAQAPGAGGDVSAIVPILLNPPPGVDQNAAWQAVNKALNARMNMTMVGSDYNTKFATAMAGNDLPDLLGMPTTLNVQSLPQFLQEKCADLTAYLAGDGIRQYPNLANIPTLPWKQTVYNGGLYGVPIPRPFIQGIWYYNADRFDSLGLAQPKSADDFKQALKGLTDASNGKWAIASTPANAFGMVGINATPYLSTWKVPNNWRADGSGNFTKDIETDEYKSALGWLRDVWAAGYFFPDSASATNSSNKLALLAGKFAIYGDGFFSYGPEYWDGGLKAKPPVRLRTLRPFAADGGKPVWHQFNAFFGMTAMKKASPDRITELLRIFNYLAAPFGSEEALLLEYGVKDVDFSFDANGNPNLSPKGQAETNVTWRYLTMRPQVLFDPNDANFAKTAYADEQAIIPVQISDPSLGLYSATDKNKGSVIFQKVTDALAEIVANRRPLSDFDQLLKDWKSAGGDQIRLEYQQAYAASKR
ncbi:MAG: twin-arginine translocation signal domain-containing protein [Chloroflexi bacterium]|nr:twin-arginine translocation signal domain-containing protein [Chloroflexota bacterium]